MRKKILSFIAMSMCVFTCGADAANKEPSRHDKIYYLQHRLLPRWTFHTKGAFFENLSEGKTGQLTEAATEMIDGDFAKAITVRKLAGQNAILLSFPKPAKVPECYHVIIEKTRNSFRYVTLEMAEDILNLGTKTALCEWTAEGSHRNFGPRKYTDAQRFLEDALKNKKKN